MKKSMAIGISILSCVVGGMIGAIAVIILNQDLMIEKKRQAEKYKRYYNTLIEMINCKHKGRKVEQYFIDNGYKEIAIYGMGEIGKCLYEELKNSSIIVKYAIDKDAVCMNEDVKVFEPINTLEEVDVIVVTAVFAYNDIECELRDLIDIPIVSIEDIFVN